MADVLSADDALDPIAAPRLDQRSARRHSQVLLVGRVQAHGVESICLVHDISDGGLKARFGIPLAIGDRLSVEVRGLPPIAGEVRWTRDGRTGVAFVHEQDVERVFRRLRSDGTVARSPRFHVAAAARLQLGQAAFDATVVDISLGGAKLASDERVKAGQAGHIRLRDAGATLFGTICWAGEGAFGFRFATALAIATLTQVLATAPRPGSGG